MLISCVQNGGTMKQKTPILSVTTAVTALLLCSCTPVRIAQINADPLRYRNRTVHVQGVVTESAGAFSFGGYQVSDGTGKIYVLSTRGVPATGAHVSVAGSVVNGVTIGSRSFGTAIEERNHHVEN
jgi:hypothetical protein